MTPRLRGFALSAIGLFLGLLPLTGARAEYPWDQANLDGFGDSGNTQSFSMAVYNNALYVGTENNSGCEVWRYDGPDRSDWTQINSNGFGSSANAIAVSMAEYKSNLYVGVINVLYGAEVWEYDGAVWTQVASGGFGRGSNLQWPFVMEVFDDKLWVGTGDWLANHAELWVYDGSTWSQMNITGFGDSRNDYIRSLAVYKGSLYAGTYNEDDGGELWRFDGPGPANWTQIGANGLGNKNNIEIRSLALFDDTLILGTANQVTGPQVWSYDGLSFSRIDSGGLEGKSVRSMTVTQDLPRLYVGTGSVSGGAQVWEYDGLGWTQANTNGFGDSANAAAHSLQVFGMTLWVGTGKARDEIARVWRTGWLFRDGFETGNTSSWSSAVP